MIYIHILTFLCKIIGSIASNYWSSSRGSYSRTLPGLLNKVTLLTWTHRGPLFCDPASLAHWLMSQFWPQACWKTFSKISQKNNLHLPPSTGDFTKTLLSFQSTTRLRLSSSLLRSTPTGVVENIRQPSSGPPSWPRRSSLQPVSPVILCHSRTNSSTYTMSTFPAKADVQCATSNVVSQMFWM